MKPPAVGQDIAIIDPTDCLVRTGRLVGIVPGFRCYRVAIPSPNGGGRYLVQVSLYEICSHETTVPERKKVNAKNVRAVLASTGITTTVRVNTAKYDATIRPEEGQRFTLEAAAAIVDALQAVWPDHKVVFPEHGDRLIRLATSRELPDTGTRNADLREGAPIVDARTGSVVWVRELFASKSSDLYGGAPAGTEYVSWIADDGSMGTTWPRLVFPLTINTGR
jgi:hypothetical protein